MIWQYYLCMILSCSLIAALPFTKIASTGYLYAAGLLLALLSNAAWLSLTRVADKIELARLGIIWDALLTLCYIVVPVILGARFSLQMAVAVLIIICGVLIAKQG